jgi:Predicted metal-dependent hydrolase
MSTDSDILEVSGLSVQVVRKKIKNLHLSVCPPDGNVRIAAPMKTSSDNVRLAVISRLPWIRKKQAEFESQPRQSERLFVNGESHYFQGRRYVLEVVEASGPSSLRIKNKSKMLLTIRPNSSVEKRALMS